MSISDIESMVLELARTQPRASGAWNGYERFRAILGPDQLALINDPAPLVAADPGRRAGKTTAFIGKTLKVFEEHERAPVFYFAPTGEQGVDILWEELREYNRTFDLGLGEHWSEKWWTLGARKLEVFSFHERKDVEQARGRKARLVCVDEAQLAPDWFAKTAEAAIFPTVIDYLGQVWACGTPAPVAAGFFFEAIHDVQKWSSGHHWLATVNPWFAKQGRDPLRKARERYKWTEDSPTYRREWLGLWIVDPDELVYYIPDDAVQSRVGNWHGNILGLDMGWKDHDAIAVMGVEPLRQWSHLRHMETQGQQTNHQLFARLLQLGERFPGPSGGPPIVVYDPAGHATKKTIETFRSDAPAIQWVEADKREKVQSIEWLNNDLREGSTTVEAGCSMVKEALRLRWKRPGKVAEDADHSDQGDAWLYSWRYARNLLRKLAKPVERKQLDPFEEHMEKLKAQQEGNNYFASRIRRVG